MKLNYILIIFVSLSSSFALADSLTTAFTYQGRLTSGSGVANGSYDFEFHLRDAPAAGNPVSITNTLAAIVSNGLFTVALDFGANTFTNTDRWLEIAVRANGDSIFTTLSPRQQLTPTPYAMFSANALTATTLLGTFSGNLIQAGTVNSNALDTATAAQLARAGAISSTNWVNVMAFGALGGSHDDTAAFQTALNSGTMVFVPPTTNFTVGTLYLTNGARIFGYGSRMDFKSGVNNAAMFEQGTNINISMQGLALYGGDFSDTVTRTGSSGRIGIRPFCYGAGSEIYNVSVGGFDYGVYPTGNRHTTNSYLTTAISLHDITCYSNYCGLRLHSPTDTQMVEYLDLRNMNLYGNNIGYYESAGNNSITASRIDGNIHGVVCDGAIGVNPNHGIISSTKINHNDYGLCLTNLSTYGILITGCRIHNSGNSYFNNCQGVQIIGNYLDIGFIRCYGNYSNNFIIGNMYAGVYTNGGTPYSQNFAWVTGENLFTHYGNYSYSVPGNTDGIINATNVPSIGNALRWNGTNYYWGN